ncbi:hypothetical protein H2200_000523 [Cladophialophora chaetospira]|uniref:Phosphoglycerate mutase family protein n=1 Tax=Cladophialophora chaetospira TaxID=386627 RepID=A0AA38XNP9_9EURO|nr:hypothetical protein H2200_000523 [Cladophialophora chaetospira]
MADDEQAPTLYLIRHGEKDKLPNGEDAVGLNARGQNRADALVQVFGRNSPYNIGYIIAQKEKKHGKEDRPYLTAKPLADSLEQYGVQFNHTIDRDDYDEVKAAVDGYRGDGNVLICWEHQALEKVAVALGVQPEPNYPGTRFDIIWTVKPPYTEIEQPVGSEQVPGLDVPSGNGPGPVQPPS